MSVCTKGKILSELPDSLAYPVDRWQSPASIGCLFVGQDLFQERAAHQGPGPMAVVDKGKGRRHSNLFLKGREQRRLIAMNRVKQRQGSQGTG